MHITMVVIYHYTTVEPRKTHLFPELLQHGCHIRAHLAVKELRY